MSKLQITRTGEKSFTAQSGSHQYHITGDPRWSCDCPARGMCKHLRTALSYFGMAVGQTVAICAKTDKSGDDGLLDAHEFDFEAGRDIDAELRYIRSGREKRNLGC